MIFCLLIEVTHNQQGVAIRKERVVTGESLQIGRDAACKIRLPDHRVDLHHATLSRSQDGTLHIRGNAPIKINGVVEQAAMLPPGARVEIGPYLLTVDPASAGRNISLSVEMIRPPHEPESQVEPVTIADLGISKRKLGLGSAAGILFLFLLLPLLPSISSGLDKWQSSLPVTLTDALNPGPLSQGHSALGIKCSSCHQRAFAPVSDEACSACHKKVGHHLADNALHASLFKDARCTDCHVDHRGEAGLLRQNSSRCVACHGDLRSKKTDTTIANIHDFAKDHPPFRITIQNGKDERSVIRVPQNQKDQIVERSGLKYSHQVHLDKKGISSPQGDIVMTCQNCHQPDESGIHFRPISMKQTCQQSGCHSLDFTEPVEGTVPHGSEREVMIRLRDYFVKWLADSPANMAECGQPDNSVQHTLECAGALARKNAATSLFRKDVECGECHEIEFSGERDVPWKVKPVRINRNWFSKSIFPHAKHGTTDCISCHDKINSKTSSDIAMPTIEKCRECHVGDRHVKGKASSSCNSCHRFHGGKDANKQ